MGKHHWKVEKQPEWYVKAVRKTIAALPGGYAEAADWLDVTENALFNRLRADGDQIFPLGWAMILQRAGGTHFIADAVAQSANGVFPPTNQEVATMLGYRSVNAAVEHLRALEKKGVITIKRGVARGITLHTAVKDDDSEAVGIIRSLLAGEENARLRAAHWLHERGLKV
ncbi:TPA: hypothetical protein JLC66_003151 [Escherichia coli]|nr:hypothetical protein [Escherichia coli]